VDLTCEVGRETTVEEVNETFRRRAEGPLEGILEVSDLPLVSVDYVGNSSSSVVDLQSTAVIEGRLVKVLAWYDNEWGYSARVADLVRYVGERLAVEV
jgi:glyceraldehyde 3-phosphate dehydrogenase